jgi:uncharacterized membrane protein YccC
MGYQLACSLGLHEALWAAISAVVVSQEYLHETQSSLAGRIFGTLLGTGITVAVSQAASHAAVAIVVQMSIAVAICALVVRRFPALRVAMWTCPIILLKTQVSEPIVVVALHRGSEVILGAIVGLDNSLGRRGRCGRVCQTPPCIGNQFGERQAIAAM